MKKRTVILFGAGAVIGWGAPSTPKITEVVRKCGFVTSDNKTRITEFIYQKLINEGGFKEEEVNFETIINVIEELIVYYSKHGLFESRGSIIKPFLTPTFESVILNFEVLKNTSHNGFILKIPGRDQEWAQRSQGKESPEQFFLLQLIGEILTEITTHIDNYTLHTTTYSNVLVEEKSELNRLFGDWIKKESEDVILRMYTLNYDRLFKILALQYGYLDYVFEGFDCDERIDYYPKLRPNIRRILLDEHCNTHYNLHGSIFWQVERYNHHQLELPYFCLSGMPYLEVNTDEYPTFQCEKGKTIFLTNIVTGYQKTQRSIFSPFKQMQACFDKDCIVGDKLIIVGYSFADEHINASIRTALEVNPDIKIEIIDPSFKKNEFDVRVMISIFSASFRNTTPPTNIALNVHGFLNNSIIIHAKTFQEYMLDMTNVV